MSSKTNTETTVSRAAWLRALRLAVLMVAAVSMASGCDDDGAPGGDTSMQDTTEPDGQDVTGDTSDDVADTGDDAAEDTGGDDTPDAEDADTADVGDTGDAGDTGQDVDADMAMCPSSCAAGMVCNEETGFECTCGPAFGDCDGDPGNGCETDVSVPEQCGACGAMADPVCLAPGVEPLCQPIDMAPPGGPTHECARQCQQGYLDLDSDLNFPQLVNGCETGVLPTTSAPQDLSAALGSTGDIVALDHDGTHLFALTDDGDQYTLHAFTVAPDGSLTWIDDIQVGDAGGSDSLAVHGGIAVVPDGGAAHFYEFDGTVFNLVTFSATAADPTSVVSLAPGLVANSQAEFVAAIGGGIAWYGVFASETDAPATANCINGGRVCILDTSPLPTNSTNVTLATLGGELWAVGVGDATVEHGFDAPTHQLNAAPAIGPTANIPTDALDFASLPDDELVALHADGTLTWYVYTLNLGEPDTRSLTGQTLSSTSGTATSFEVLDARRWLLATTTGLVLVYHDPDEAQPTQLAIDDAVLPQVDAMTLEGDRLYAADGKSLVVYDLVLDAFEP